MPLLGSPLARCCGFFQHRPAHGLCPTLAKIVPIGGITVPEAKPVDQIGRVTNIMSCRLTEIEGVLIRARLALFGRLARSRTVVRQRIEQGGGNLRRKYIKFAEEFIAVLEHHPLTPPPNGARFFRNHRKERLLEPSEEGSSSEGTLSIGLDETIQMCSNLNLIFELILLISGIFILS